MAEKADIELQEPRTGQIEAQRRPESIASVDVDKPDENFGRVDTHGFTTEEHAVPKGYFMSRFFVGTMAATGLGVASAVGGFALAAPNLTLINSEIGPDANIYWVSLVYTLTLAVGLILVGRLSDLFGRRWFFIGAAVLAIIGDIVSATAQSVPALIGGVALIGLAAAGQQSFAFITGEIVPMKYRFLANGFMYLCTMPLGGCAPLVSKAMILYTTATWRWCFWSMLIVNFSSGLLFFLFYFPPSFEMKFEGRTKWEQMKEFDYIGTVLMIAGLLLFLMGLNWGGNAYDWNSAHVIATMVVGAVVLIVFVLYELYANPKEPILPLHIFKNSGWVASIILLGLGASIYYAMAIIWPEMVAILYTDDGGASIYAGAISCMPTIAIVFGQVVAGILAVPIGHQKYQCMGVLIIGGALLGAMASADQYTLNRALVLMFLSSFFIGWNESVSLSNSGIEVEDQREIGTAVGAAGSMRSVISCVAQAVYLAVLTNRETVTIPGAVIPAVEAAGLPASSTAAFLQGFTSGSFAGIPGVNDNIIAVGQQAYRLGCTQAFQTVFYTTIAFTGIAIIVSFWSPTVDSKMDGRIAVTLNENKRKGEHVEVAV